MKFLKLMMIVGFTENNILEISASPTARFRRRRTENPDKCSREQQEICRSTCNLDRTKIAKCSLNAFGGPICTCECEKGYESNNCGKQSDSAGQSLDQTIAENGRLLIST